MISWKAGTGSGQPCCSCLLSAMYLWGVVKTLFPACVNPCSQSRVHIFCASIHVYWEYVVSLAFSEPDYLGTATLHLQGYQIQKSNLEFQRDYSASCRRTKGLSGRNLYGDKHPFSKLNVNNFLLLLQKYGKSQNLFLHLILNREQ